MDADVDVGGVDVSNGGVDGVDGGDGGYVCGGFGGE